MARIPTWITVVAGAMQDSQGRFLLQRRPLAKHHGGLWEFPGGKVEPGESPRNALVRELNEELTVRVDIRAIEPLSFAEEEPQGDHPGVVILLYKISAWQGFPVAEAGADLGWFDIADAIRLPVPPLDLSLLGSLRAGAQ